MQSALWFLRNQWWGFSSENGWVILDRDLPENQPGLLRDFTFLRCENWSYYNEKREKWREPFYIHLSQYIIQLKKDDARKSFEIIEYLLAEYDRRKKSIFFSLVEERHNYLLNLHSLTPKELILSENILSNAKCSYCGIFLNYKFEIRCSGCDTFVCSACGACKCIESSSSRNVHFKEQIGQFINKSEKFHKYWVAGIYSNFKEAREYAINHPGTTLSRTYDGRSWQVTEIMGKTKEEYSVFESFKEAARYLKEHPNNKLIRINKVDEQIIVFYVPDRVKIKATITPIPRKSFKENKGEERDEEEENEEEENEEGESDYKRLLEEYGRVCYMCNGTGYEGYIYCPCCLGWGMILY